MSKSGPSRKVENPNDEFGVTSTTPSIAGGGAGKGKEKEGGVEELHFLDYVTCSICGHPFYSKSEADRKFWMTSCGHVLCGAREHNHQKGRCTRCKKEEIEVYPIDENIHPDLRSWFGNPTDNVAVVAASLKRTVQELEVGSLAISSFQTQELMRLVKLLRLSDERKEENIKLVKVELQKMGQMKKELADVKGQLAEAQAKNEELAREIEQLRSAQHQPRFPPPLSSFSHQPFNPLMPVAEEGEDMGYSDSGPQSIRRMEMELANQRSRDTRANGHDQFTTPRAMPSASRLTLPHPTDRPATAEPGREGREGREGRLSRSGPSRVNLDKYRLSDTHGQSTPYSSHPYARPSSAMASSARPASVRPFGLARAPTSALAGLPVNGRANSFVPNGDGFASSQGSQYAGGGGGTFQSNDMYEQQDGDGKY